MPNYISKKKINTNKKLKKSRKNKIQLQSGGVLSKKPSIFRDIIYSKSNFKLPELICNICSENIFKMRTMKVSTAKKAFFLGGNFWDNRFKFFTCTNCGKIEIFSNNITFHEEIVKT